MQRDVYKVVIVSQWSTTCCFDSSGFGWKTRSVWHIQCFAFYVSVSVYKASSCTKNDWFPRFLSYSFHSMPCEWSGRPAEVRTLDGPQFSLSSLIIREFGSHTIPLSKFASAILSSVYSTKAIALVSVKCRCTRYLRLVSVLPAVDGSQHSPNLVKQREEKSGTHQRTTPRKGRYSRAGAWKLNSHCEIAQTSFLDQSRWFFCPTYLEVAGGNGVAYILPATNACLFILSSHSQ